MINGDVFCSINATIMLPCEILLWEEPGAMAGAHLLFWFVPLLLTPVTTEESLALPSVFPLSGINTH